MTPEQEAVFETAVSHVHALLRAACPDDPRVAIECALLGAYSYCLHDLKMPKTEAVEAIDMCWTALMEKILSP